MSDIHHPDEAPGGLFLLLTILFVILWSYFVIYKAVGNFKECDAVKYPNQAFCIERKAE